MPVSLVNTTMETYFQEAVEPADGLGQADHLATSTMFS